MIWGETPCFGNHPHPFYICNAQGLQHWVCDLRVEELSEVANRCADMRRMASDTPFFSQLRSLRCAFLWLLLSWTMRNEKISIKKLENPFLFFGRPGSLPPRCGVWASLFSSPKTTAQVWPISSDHKVPPFGHKNHKNHCQIEKPRDVEEKSLTRCIELAVDHWAIGSFTLWKSLHQLPFHRTIFPQLQAPQCTCRQREFRMTNIVTSSSQCVKIQVVAPQTLRESW